MLQSVWHISWHIKSARFSSCIYFWNRSRNSTSVFFFPYASITFSHIDTISLLLEINARHCVASEGVVEQLAMQPFSHTP